MAFPSVKQSFCKICHCQTCRCPVCIPLLLRLAVLKNDAGGTVENFQTRGCLQNFLQTRPSLRQHLHNIVGVLQKEEAYCVGLENVRKTQLTRPPAPSRKRVRFSDSLNFDSSDSEQCIYSDHEWNKYFAAGNFLYDAWARLLFAIEP